MTGEPLALEGWLERERSAIAHRWRQEIRSRAGVKRDEGDGVLRTFLEALVSFLPACLGDGREEGEAVWDQATHLYGSYALHRGLAAGEVVEEIGLLRAAILRSLLEHPALDWSDRGFHKDLLTLNRVLDAGVVRASVAYVDDLFFAHLQGSGVPEGVTAELEGEIIRQLAAFQRDLRS